MTKPKADAPLYCPICKGQLLSRDVSTDIHTVERVSGERFHCPSCEMFVEPTGSGVNPDSEPDDPAGAPAYPGRTRRSGTNAGGSQRGDLSDEGASQWRWDPRDDSERNTWHEKD